MAAMWHSQMISLEVQYFYQIVQRIFLVVKNFEWYQHIHLGVSVQDHYQFLLKAIEMNSMAQEQNQG